MEDPYANTFFNPPPKVAVKIFECEFCPMDFKKFINWSRHSNTRHRLDVQRRNEAKAKEDLKWAWKSCPKCDFEHQDPEIFKNHKKTAHPPEKFHCFQCHFECISKAAFSKHYDECSKKYLPF